MSNVDKKAKISSAKLSKKQIDMIKSEIRSEFISRVGNFTLGIFVGVLDFFYWRHFFNVLAPGDSIVFGLILFSVGFIGAFVAFMLILFAFSEEIAL